MVFHFPFFADNTREVQEEALGGSALSLAVVTSTQPMKPWRIGMIDPDKYFCDSLEKRQPLSQHWAQPLRYSNLFFLVSGHIYILLKLLLLFQSPCNIYRTPPSDPQSFSLSPHTERRTQLVLNPYKSLQMVSSHPSSLIQSVLTAENANLNGFLLLFP